MGTRSVAYQCADWTTKQLRLSGTLDRLEALSRPSLVEECVKLRLPSPPVHVTHAELLRRLTWAMSLQELSFVELRKESVSSGVKGYHSAPEERRPEMVDKLHAIIWQGLTSKEGTAPGPPRVNTAGDKLVEHFRSLELPVTASLDDVKKSYKRLALKFHPDKQQEGSEDVSEQFLRVSEAYEVLSTALAKK